MSSGCPEDLWAWKHQAHMLGMMCAWSTSSPFLSPVGTVSVYGWDDQIQEPSHFFLALAGAYCSLTQPLLTNAQHPRPCSSVWGHSITAQDTGDALHATPTSWAFPPGVGRQASKINIKCSWMQDTASLPAWAVIHVSVSSTGSLNTYYVPSTMLNTGIWNWITSGSPGIISPEKEVSEEHRLLSCVFPS